MSSTAEAASEIEEQVQPELDSKYRLIIVAAQRSKQLQRGARPRVEIDPQKHKPTRIALEEVLNGKVPFAITDLKQATKEEKE
ncbi:MAG TPA: DNA-directed RNA polymerase subunit omega [Pyrinomonadaceae bacterium]|jgi:DNA-directed RNA polymerase subunit omega